LPDPETGFFAAARQTLYNPGAFVLNDVSGGKAEAPLLRKAKLKVDH
jgi:hypothetical protein